LFAVSGSTNSVGTSERHGISNVHYEVTFDASTAPDRLIHVAMSFDVDGAEAIALSLPSWTPGSYQLDDFAKNVRNVSAHLASSEIRWDKSDFDTWRVYPTGAGRVTIEFDYRADQLDVGQAWATNDLAFFNGTNLFFYPEGQDLSFASEVAFHTESDWAVATGLTSTGSGWEFSAENYHELVDMPTFVGDFEMDSTEIGGAWYRLASYPVGALTGQPRAALWSQIEAMMPPMEAVTDDVPWDQYTTMTVFDESFSGGSALEHSNSHLGVYHPQFIGSTVLASITAHEIFHAWNVKRIRPAQMWPYDYGRQMPTELLWVSEGITDYYADLGAGARRHHRR
jgi:predicted metalloprotease with PDZ domain